MFSKVLIANRGEIAVRVIRTLRKMGIKSVAVCSTADRDALHVKMADEHVCIGDPPPLSSYLNMQAIIKAALDTGAEAIHPGYGFLSENPEFARKVQEAGLVFIGPDPYASETMGNKTRARKKLLKKRRTGQNRLLVMPQFTLRNMCQILTTSRFRYLPIIMEIPYTFLKENVPSREDIKK